MMDKVCSLTSSSTIHPKRRKPVQSKYWWNFKIAATRKACIAARRLIERVKGDKEAISKIIKHYRSCRTALRKEIAEKKKKFWKELGQNPGGQPYKIAFGIMEKTLKIHLPDQGKRDILS